MSELYPLKFRPIFKEKLWGGQKIKSILNKDFGQLSNCGETWELSGVEGNISVVSNGSFEGKTIKRLIQERGQELLGKKVYATYGDEFPLLVKFIDANQDLSIQVHPNDEIAKEKHACMGKTEMWYVMQADTGASLISGFNQDMDKESYLRAFESGQLTSILNQEKVEAGDIFFIPAGRVHTIGKGLLIAEIQQTSDITYRIYDFDRVDSHGNKRELHVEQAIDTIDFKKYPNYKTHYERQKNVRLPVVSCEYFKTNKLILEKPFDATTPDLDTFRILTCVGGKGNIQYHGGSIGIRQGEVVLIPAVIDEYELVPDQEVILLESYID